MDLLVVQLLKTCQNPISATIRTSWDPFPSRPLVLLTTWIPQNLCLHPTKQPKCFNGRIQRKAYTILYEMRYTTPTKGSVSTKAEFPRMGTPKRPSWEYMAAAWRHGIVLSLILRFLRLTNVGREDGRARHRSNRFRFRLTSSCHRGDIQSAVDEVHSLKKESDGNAYRVKRISICRARPSTNNSQLGDKRAALKRLNRCSPMLIEDFFLNYKAFC